MKVLLISHTCQSRTKGQPKAQYLSEYDDIDLTVLVPDLMRTYGEWHSAELPDTYGYRFEVGKTRLRSILNQWYFQHYANAIPRLLHEIKPDIVDIWEEPWSATCAQAIYHTRKLCPSAKIIVETEQNIFRKLPQPFCVIQDYSLSRCDFVVGRSREAVEVARQKGYSGSARVVPNAVDCDLFNPLPNEIRTSLRAELGWGGDDRFVMGYAGRLVAEKGLADSVKALTLLGPEVSLAFVGDGSCKQDLIDLATSIGVLERVHFIPACPQVELPRYLNSFDALVIPSRTTPTWKEQFGRVIIEAGACRVPSIGSDSGAIPDVIGRGGLTFSEGNIEGLARCVNTMMQDRAKHDEFAEAAHMQAHTLYTWKQVASNMHDIYVSLAEASATDGFVK